MKADATDLHCYTLIQNQNTTILLVVANAFLFSWLHWEWRRHRTLDKNSQFCPAKTIKDGENMQQLVWSDEGRRHRPPLLHTDPKSKYNNLTSCCQCFLVLVVTWQMAPAPNTGQKFTILPSMMRWRPTPPTSSTTHWSKIKILWQSSIWYGGTIGQRHDCPTIWLSNFSFDKVLLTPCYTW